MNVKKLDPSCAIGFYCRNQGDLNDLLNRMPKLMETTDTSRVPSKSKYIVEVLDYDCELPTV